jgi:hypothetical protein
MFKKSLGAILISSSIIFSGSSSSSGMPSIDAPNLGANILENIRVLFESEEYRSMFMNKLDFNSMLEEMNTDNENNSWANVIVRGGASKQSVQNLELARKTEPGVMVCEIDAALIKEECFTKDSQRDMEDEDLLYITNEEKKNGSVGVSIDTIMNRILGNAEIARPKEYVSSEIKNKDMSIPNPLSAQYLIGSVGGTLVLSPENFKYTTDYIDLLAPPYISSYRDKHLINSNKKLITKEISKMSKKAYPRRILQKLLSQRMIDGSNTSELYRMTEIAKYNFSNPNSLETVAAKIALSKLDSPDAIWRNMAVNKAFLSDLALKKFKTSLDQEAMESIIMMYNINK